MAKNLGAIKEFNGLIDLPGGGNILAAGKNTSIWKAVLQNRIASYYRAQPRHLKAPPVIKHAIGVK